MRPNEVIHRVRDGRAVPPEAIAALVAGYTAGAVPDYQMAAFCMAVFFRGLPGDGLEALTRAMLESGEVLDLSDIPGPKVDKHSTGGVGDKVSLALAPLAAACGVKVPMISGRGLGHTGGTLDKLESIPGFRVDLPVARFREIVASVGACLIGQTPEIAPADRKLYALRDVTATVESLPLIAASIMSKKMAEVRGSPDVSRPRIRRRLYARTLQTGGSDESRRSPVVIAARSVDLRRARHANCGEVHAAPSRHG